MSEVESLFPEFGAKKTRVRLFSPGELEIHSAFDNLLPPGAAVICCSFADSPNIINALERAGFIGIVMRTRRGFVRDLQILAFKRGEGPCHDSGKSASYLGSARAAVDDENHLLFGATRVCERTALVYGLPIFKNVVGLTRGDPELIRRLETAPAPFDCDTFESDARRLADSFSESVKQQTSTKAVLYPGPFKMLIMPDGSMVRRGVPVRLSDAAARALAESDGGLFLRGDLEEEAEKAPHFPSLFLAQGSLCLIDIPERSPLLEPARACDFGALRDTPPEMKLRLLNLIESNAEYFILTGSDSRDREGCCPSDGVSAANRLVEAGLLQVVRPGAPAESCPVNVYAFSGEIEVRDEGPVFSIDDEFRRRVNNAILRYPSRRNIGLVLLRWSLLLFVGLSLTVSALHIRRRGNLPSGFKDLNLREEFDLPFRHGWLVLQFHRAERCRFCRDMENHTRDALNLYFSRSLEQGEIAFRTADMDLPRYRNFQEKYDLFTSTLMLIEVRRDREVRWKVVTEAWRLTGQKRKFMDMFKSEVETFQAGRK